jgi:hypothetical protein
MQLGFPNMGAVFVDQRDERSLASAIGISKSGRQFQTASAAPHDDDFVLCAHVHAHDQIDKFIGQIKRRGTPFTKNIL